MHRCFIGGDDYLVEVNITWAGSTALKIFAKVFKKYR
jgi:hypothetical protein